MSFDIALKQTIPGMFRSHKIWLKVSWLESNLPSQYYSISLHLGCRIRLCNQKKITILMVILMINMRRKNKIRKLNTIRTMMMTYTKCIIQNC